MEIISFIGENHNRVENYSPSSLISYLESRGSGKVIVAVDQSSPFLRNGAAESLRKITGAGSLSGRIVMAGIDESPYIEKRDGFMQSYSNSAEAVVKKNILDMMDTTVRSYLEGYWRDFETVNSEVTDSLFRAKHKLIATMFWEMERDTWNSMLDAMYTKIMSHSPSSADAVIVDVEKRYWLVDRINGE